MLVLTLSFNAEVLKNKSKIQENEKEILVVLKADLQYSQPTNFDYTKHHLLSFKLSDNLKETISVQETSQNDYRNHTAKNVVSSLGSRYSSDYCSGYFGLSPPLFA